MANAATDKPDGPQLIRSITPDIPTAQTGDIEEGGVPIGVAVVAAQAELIEEDVGDNNADDDHLHPTVREHLKQEKKHRGRSIFLLAMIGSVLVAGVTSFAVVATNSKRKAKKLKARFGSEGSGSSSSVASFTAKRDVRRLRHLVQSAIESTLSIHVLAVFARFVFGHRADCCRRVVIHYCLVLGATKVAGESQQ